MAADPLRLDADVRFEQLYREYAADVYRYALAIMRNPADAEDVTQATFMNAWRAFSTGEEPRAPLNWFIAIAHNVCRLRFRTKSRRPHEVEFEPALAEAPVQEGPSASDVLEALAELPLNQRAALVMRELEGRSYEDIAGILGVTRSAVETLIFRARRSLRVRRDAVRVLAVLPLPQSLVSFVRARGAVEAGAAGLLGTGAVAKAVAVLAAGVVATGVGREALRADARPDAAGGPPARVQASEPATAAPATAAPARPAAARPEKAASTPHVRAARASVHRPASRSRGVRSAPLEDTGTAAAAPAPPRAPPAQAPPAAQPEAAAPAAEPAAPPAVPPPPPAPPALLPAVPLVPTPPALPPVPAVPPVPPVAVPALPVPELPPAPALPPVELPPIAVPPVLPGLP